jgi:hypothetical protein
MSGVGTSGSANHQIALTVSSDSCELHGAEKYWGNSRIVSAPSGQLAAMTCRLFVVRALTLAVMRVVSLHSGSCGVFARGGTHEGVIVGSCSFGCRW